MSSKDKVVWVQWEDTWIPLQPKMTEEEWKQYKADNPDSIKDEKAFYEEIKRREADPTFWANKPTQWTSEQLSYFKQYQDFQLK